MPTMTDIAIECGISRSVVSLVLNGRDKELGIAASTRDQILRVAREIGYCRNELAASIGKKHSQVLAFVTADMGSVEYTGRIQNGVLDAASERGYTVTVHRLKKNTNAEIISKILGWRAAGVIFHVAELSAIQEITAVLDKNGIPWGTVNLSNPGGIGVTTDDRKGIENAVRFLAERGHRRIVFLAHGRMKLEYQRNRENGYLEGMKQYAPDFQPLICRFGGAEIENMAYLSGLVKQLNGKKADAVHDLADGVVDVRAVGELRDIVVLQMQETVREGAFELVDAVSARPDRLHDAASEIGLELRDVELEPLLFRLVAHVEDNQHRNMELGELRGKVQAALRDRRVDHVHDEVDPRPRELLERDALFRRTGGQAVDAGNVNKFDLVLAERELAGLALDRHARIVADVLACAGEAVEYRGLAAVRVSCQDDPISAAHESSCLRMTMFAASSR